MTESEHAASSAEEIGDLSWRNQTIGRPADSRDNRGDEGSDEQSRVDRLERAMAQIESMLEKLHEQQTALVTDDVRREIARFAGRLDLIEGLFASTPRVAQEPAGRTALPEAGVGLRRLVQLTHGRRPASGRARGAVAGIGTLFDLNGTESAAGLLSAYHQARSTASGRKRR
jgi:hypothetical protein